LSGEQSYERHAVGVLRLLYPLAAKHPHGFAHLLRAADFYLAPVKEVAIVGSGAEREDLLRVVRRAFRPHLVLAAGGGEPSGDLPPPAAREPVDGPPLLARRLPVDGHAAAYVCERFACQAPVTGPEQLAALLG